MKNKLLLLLVVFILITLCSCKHKHDFSSSYSYDDENHWYACSCGEKDGYAEHSWNNGTVTLQPTEDSEGERTFTCSVCRYKKVEKIDKLEPDHTHSFVILTGDDDYHWYECECGDRGNQTKHSWNGGEITTPPTVDGNGVKSYTCLVCQHTKTETLDKLGEEHTHSYDISYNDENSHWFKCVCGEETEKSSHLYDSGSFKDELTEDGYEVKVCTCLVCGVTKEELIDASVIWFEGEEVELDYAYSFAVVGDTQFLSQKYPDKMESIYDWILENKDQKKIAHVFGLGDITEGVWEVSNSDLEWTRAKEYISKLDGVIPYSLIRGNHDQISFFEKNFKNDTYMSQFDGFMNGNDIANSYKLFTVGSTDYMLLTLDYGASDEVLEWANKLIMEHSDRKVIITTHAYMYRDGTTLSMGDTALPSDHSDADSSPYKIYNDGQQMWEKLVSRHPNITLVLSGHDPSDNVVTLQSVGVHGNVVTQMLVDPQTMDYEMGGVGMICMLYFSEDGSQMEVEWLSASTGKYYKHRNQFSVDLSASANESHDFHNAYNQTHHFMACECGYTYGMEAHQFDGGVVNTAGQKVYSCQCGYTRVNSDIYATTSLMSIDGKLLGTVETKADASGLCHITVPLIDGYVAEYDTYVFSVAHDSLINVIYYSPISVWDGVSASSALSGSGTAADPYLILSAADFVYLKNAESGKKYFKLMSSIDLNNMSFCVDSFDGILEGNHCSIRGINVSSSTNNTGLFNILEENSAVYNLSLYGKVSGAQYTGALAGVAKGEVRNVVNFATVSGAGNLGGVVGNSANTSRISYCVNFGNINGSSWNNGGVVGFAQNSILYCINYGNVKTTADCAGGVVGSSHSFIYHCINYGTVTATGRAGGIAYNSNKMLDYCVNYGDVVGSLPNSWDLGGILGFVAKDYSSIVSNCVNNGSVTGATCIGGILGASGSASGYASSITVINCVNNGKITATWGGGGIVGSTEYGTSGLISGCVNSGEVTGNGTLGGIIGKTNIEVTECTNDGNVVGNTDIIGGIAGWVVNTACGKKIWTTNYQNGSVSGPNAQQIIGKGYVYTEGTQQSGALTVEEFNSQPSMFGSPWVSAKTRMKIVVQIEMTRGTTITFLGDTSKYCWGVMETTDKDNASAGAWKDTGWNTSWDDPTQKTYTTTYARGYFVITVGKLDSSGSPTITLTQEELDEIHSMFRVEGTKAAEGASNVTNNPTLNDPMVSVNHRGWYKAPENTLSAYRESYNQGFKYVECDVQFTKDGVAVLLHDDTIDRTSNGSGTLSQMTYAELLQYDFSYDDNDSANDFSAYRGEKIPTFVDFIALCKELGLHPYIEIKGNLTEAEATELVRIVSEAGMLDSVSWLGFSGDALAMIVSCDPTARLVWVLSDTYDSKIAANNIPFAMANLMTGESEVVFDLYYTLVSQSIVDLLMEYNIPLEVWTVNDINAIYNLHPYVSGVSSDYFNAKELLNK